MEELLEVVPGHPCILAMLTGRGGKLGGAATEEPILASGYLLLRRRGANDVLKLVEQLDVATSTLREESREADRLCLSIATVKWEMAAAELAAAEA
jgi:hypothetical protein